MCFERMFIFNDMGDRHTRAFGSDCVIAESAQSSHVDVSDHELSDKALLDLVAPLAASQRHWMISRFPFSTASSMNTRSVQKSELFVAMSMKGCSVSKNCFHITVLS